MPRNIKVSNNLLSSCASNFTSESGSYSASSSLGVELRKKTVKESRKVFTMDSRSVSSERIDHQITLDIKTKCILEVQLVCPWLLESMENSSGQYMLGTSYLHGDDLLKKDDDKAFFWLKHSAKNKHPDALRLLGTFYLYGIIVGKNIDKARKYIQLSAALNNETAKGLLKEVKEVKKDIKLKDWFPKRVRGYFHK